MREGALIAVGGELEVLVGVVVVGELEVLVGVVVVGGWVAAWVGMRVMCD